MGVAHITVNLDKVKHNARTIVTMCRKKGIEVVGVTKGVCGHPALAKSMLQGGVAYLADSRMDNIQRMKRAGVRSKMMLIRIPVLSKVGCVAKDSSISLNSEWDVIQRLAKTASRKGYDHKIMVMIDVGDLREGVMQEHAIDLIQRVIHLKGAQFEGIGTNVGCYGGVIPTEDNMGALCKIVDLVNRTLNIPVPTVSVGGTNCLSLIAQGRMPKGVTQVRVGEGILLGRNSSTDTIVPGTYQDAFRLTTEIIEINEKPTKPKGEIGLDAFGEIPRFKDLGIRRRAIIALGKQDVQLDGLEPMDPGIVVMGGSSDHIILDITDSQKTYKVGDCIEFGLYYSGLLSAFTSPYIEQRLEEDRSWTSA